MKEFLGKDFLLENATAIKLYEGYAKEQPIFDFHCHLNPQEIYEDKKYRSLTEVWLGGDHYKWRLLREMGVSEDYITGNRSDKEKFDKYAEVIPYSIGNPLYQWTHLELKRYFGIDEILSLKTADKIYQEANKKLETLTARKLITNNNVKIIFTTDDPIDDLKYHKLLANDDSFDVKVLPAFRPDKAINIDRATFLPYIDSLSKVVDYPINSIFDLTKALEERIDYFNNVGCVCSDHALDTVVYQEADENEVNAIFIKAKKEKLNSNEIAKYKSYILTFLGKEYHKRNWVQQYHIGALRSVSSRYFQLLGPDTGFDATYDEPVAYALSKLLDSQDKTNQLPKTILYCLNNADNQTLATLMNCFQGDECEGKIQFGSAWWFNDQKDGMEKQIEMLSQVGLLSKFVGMLTDSRSFLSYTRHEYFRRLLCNKLGTLIEKGEYPNDIAFVGQVVSDICYNNAVKYFFGK